MENMKIKVKAHKEDRLVFEVWIGGALVAVIHCDFFNGISYEAYEKIVNGESVEFELKEVKNG